MDIPEIEGMNMV
jgi:hypothetical protein